MRTATQGEHSASQLKAHLQLPCSESTVRRILQSVDWLRYSNMKNTLQLSAEHTTCRLAWTEETTLQPDQWTTVVFSDEKTWDLDGPDGLPHY